MTAERNTRTTADTLKKEEVLAAIFDDLRRVFQVVHEHSRRVEKDTGLTGPQVWAIKVIAEAAPIKVSALARRMYLHVATVVGIVDRLEARGLVRRLRDTKDRRIVHVELTDAGRSLVVNAPQVAQGMLVSGLEGLPDRKLRSIHRSLAMVVRMLNAQELAPRLILSHEVNAPNRTPGH